MSAADSAIIDLLYEVLEHHADSTIRRCITPSGERANIEFGPRLISIHSAATRDEFAVSLLHELVHLKRGRSRTDPDAVAAEEQAVNEVTARLAVPADCLAGVHDMADLRSWSATLGVDVETLRLALALAARDRMEGTS